MIDIAIKVYIVASVVFTTGFLGAVVISVAVRRYWD